MIKLNDHYFIAWLKVVKHYEFSVVNNVIMVNMTPREYTEAKTEYENTHKPVLKEIRKVVKTLVTLTSKSN